MTRFNAYSAVACLLLLSACQDTSPHFPSAPSAALSETGITNLVTGSYSANVGAAAPIIAAFDLSAMTHSASGARGEFTFLAETVDGTIDFVGRVICLSVDPDLKRAWIGAVITRNGSTRPTHNGTNPIHQVGRDIWFRVADRSNGGSGDPDRTTSVGFQGSAGITTSPEYCAVRPWGNDGVGILSGNVKIH